MFGVHLMRIAINGLGVVPGGAGGGDTYVRGIVRGLARAGPDHRFGVFVTRSNRHAFEPAPPNVELLEVRIANRFRPWRVLYEQFVLPSRIRAWKAEVTFFPLNMMPLRMRRDEPAVLCVHDASPLVYINQLSGTFRRWRMRVVLWFERKSAHRASRVITVSHFAASEVAMLSGLPEHEILVVSPGITTPDEVEGAPDLRPGRPYILLVGRVNQHKNFHGFVRAYAAARQRFGLEHAVVIAGPPGGGQSDLQRAIIETRMQSHVHVLGAVASAELALLYSGADLFVLPSVYEGFGFPLLEALEFGLPCIATDCCSLPEVGAEAALYVRPNDEQAMAEAVGKVLCDPELRQRLSDKGKLRAQEFSWQIAGRMLLSVLERVAPSAPAESGR